MKLLFLSLCVSLLFVSAEETEEPPLAAHEFTADVSKMMKILINSLYSNKDIFLRELISNAADALNKVRFQALTDKEILGEGDVAKMDIRIIPDEDENTITVLDRGIGMNKTELVENLGTLAHSGTVRFLDGVENGTSAVDLIGQFGVGFYSSFLVADKVVVTSKRMGGKQHIWQSNNAKSFEVYEDKNGADLHRGTKVTLHLSDKSYTNPQKIRDLALHYSEFVDFPIYVRVERDLSDPEARKRREAEEEREREEKEEGDEEEETQKKGEPSYTTEDGRVFDFVHVNPRKAIWLRDPKEIPDADYIEFFRSLTRDYGDTPLTWEHFSAEGDVSFKSILFIPSTPPQSDPTPGKPFASLKLYVHRVLIAEEFDDFIPRYLAFIRGIVDSDDLQLNVSRETLQESKTMRQIGKKVVRKIIQMMTEMAEKDTSEGDNTYDFFYRKYGRSIKMGVIEDIPNRRRLARLLRFNTTKSEKTPISLDDYLERMRPGQSDFFYIAGDPATSNIQQSPFLIPYKKKGIEVLFLNDPVDEMMMRAMQEYDHKLFICVTQVEKKSLTTESDFERQKLKQWKKRFKPLVNFFKETLGEKVERVEVSTRLAADTRTPCVLAHVEGSASANMERYTRQQNRNDPRYGVYESRKVLEINPTNNLIKRMNVAVQQVEQDGIEGMVEEEEEGVEKDTNDEKVQGEKAKLETMSKLLYDTAVFESGYIIGDSNEYAERVFEVLTKMTGLPNAPVKEKDLEEDMGDDDDDDDEEEKEKEDALIEDEMKEEEEEQKMKEDRKKKKKKGGKKEEEGEKKEEEDVGGL